MYFLFFRVSCGVFFFFVSRWFSRIIISIFFKRKDFISYLSFLRKQRKRINSLQSVCVIFYSFVFLVDCFSFLFLANCFLFFNTKILSLLYLFKVAKKANKFTPKRMCIFLFFRVSCGLFYFLFLAECFSFCFSRIYADCLRRFSQIIISIFLNAKILSLNYLF